MSFTSKKNLTRTTLDFSKKTTGVSYCTSFNYLTSPKLLQNAKHIIVGTLTPKSGRDVGYFYCANNSNQIQFKLIDEWKNDGYCLEQKRQELIKSPKNKKIIDEINDILLKRGIAFLDVVKEAIAPDNDSSDDKIVEYILDKELFLDVYKNNPEIVFIVNSKRLKEVLDFMFIGKTPNIKIIPQKPRQIKGGGLKDIYRLFKAL